MRAALGPQEIVFDGRLLDFWAGAHQRTATQRPMALSAFEGFQRLLVKPMESRPGNAEGEFNASSQFPPLLTAESAI